MLTFQIVPLTVWLEMRSFCLDGVVVPPASMLSLQAPISRRQTYPPNAKSAYQRRHPMAWLARLSTRVASNLNRLGIEDSVIQAILRHSDVSVTQRCHIKTARPSTIAAIRRLSAKVVEMQARSSQSATCNSEGHDRQTEGTFRIE